MENLRGDIPFCCLLHPFKSRGGVHFADLEVIPVEEEIHPGYFQSQDAGGFRCQPFYLGSHGVFFHFAAGGKLP